MITSPRPKDDALIFRPAFKLTALAVCSLLLITILIWIPGLLSSFLLSIIFVFILAPGVDFLERRGVVRIHSIAIVLVSVLLLLVLIGSLISRVVTDEYEDFASRLDSYSEMFSGELDNRLVDLENRFGLKNLNLSQRLLKIAREKGKDALLVTGATFSIILTWLALVPLMLFFFLLDGHRIKKAFIAFLPNRYFEMSLNIHQKINRIVGGFIRAKLIESLVVSLCVMIGFFVVGLFFKPSFNYAFFLAIMVGLFNIIPYVGPAIGAIPVIFMAIVQYVLMPQFPEFSAAIDSGPSWAPVIAIIGVLAFAQVMDNVYLIPVLLGRSVNVHPLVVLLSVILGAKMLGITGMIISIPVASIVQTIVYEVSDGIKNLRH